MVNLSTDGQEKKPWLCNAKICLWIRVIVWFRDLVSHETASPSINLADDDHDLQNVAG